MLSRFQTGGRCHSHGNARPRLMMNNLMQLAHESYTTVRQIVDSTHPRSESIKIPSVRTCLVVFDVCVVLRGNLSKRVLMRAFAQTRSPRLMKAATLHGHASAVCDMSPRVLSLTSIPLRIPIVPESNDSRSTARLFHQGMCLRYKNVIA